MILDPERFAAAERPFWTELEGTLDRLERDAAARLDLPGAERLYYLYQRACADLARLATGSAEPRLRQYLETLVARAYGELNASGATTADAGNDDGQDGAAGNNDDDAAAGPWRRAWRWFVAGFPRTVRRRWRAAATAVVLTLVGCGFGALGIGMDYEEAKETILPGQFSHLNGRPSERVAREESEGGRHLRDGKASFSTALMANNIKVSFTAAALGLTWGIGTVAMLFYNGVILGAVVWDYVLDGQAVFVAGWLLPHGSVEIPSILLAGQAGLVLGGALIGWGRRARLRERMRAVTPDVATLCGGAAVLLVWAGLIEAFFSQYHEPVVPYWLKIAFGSAQLVGLGMFLALGGATKKPGLPPALTPRP